MRTIEKPALHCEEVTTPAGLAQLRRVWESLFDEAEAATPFNSWHWMSTWWDVFGHGKELRVILIREGDRVIGIAPFYERCYGVGPLRVRVLRQLGDGSELTELQGALIARGRRSDVVAQLSDHFRRRCGGCWDVLIWQGVSPQELPADLRELVRVDFQEAYPERELAPGWHEFLRQLNKSMRDNVKYYPRLLVRHGHQFRTRFLTAPEEAPHALAEFFRLHTSRSSMTGTEVHRDKFSRSFPGGERNRAFLERVAPGLMERGWLRFALYTVDDATVAAQLLLEYDDTLYVYYSGWDPTWRDYSVAMCTTAEAIRDAIDRGLRRVNFLRGVARHKRYWGTEDKLHSKLTLVRDSPLMDVLLTAFQLSRRAQAQVKSLQSRFGGAH